MAVNDLRFAANLSMLYQDLPFAERFAAAARDGFAGVEYVSPYDIDPRAIADLLADSRTTQALFNLPSGDWVAGERGIGALPDRVEEFTAGVDQAILYATALDCRRVNCLAGRAPAGVEPRELDRVLIRNLRYAAEKLADSGIRLLLEAVNTRDVPGYAVPRIDHAERILDAVGSDNLFLQFDVYHVQVMQGDIITTLRRVIDRVAHIQVADNPGRHEPGTGEIDYDFVFSEISELGYTGWIGAEYIPSDPAGPTWLTSHLGVPA